MPTLTSILRLIARLAILTTWPGCWIAGCCLGLLAVLEQRRQARLISVMPAIHLSDEEVAGLISTATVTWHRRGLMLPTLESIRFVSETITRRSHTP